METATSTISFPALMLALRGRTVRSCQSGNTWMSRDIPLFARMIEQGHVDPRPLISGTYTLEEINDAAAASERRRDPRAWSAESPLGSLPRAELGLAEPAAPPTATADEHAGGDRADQRGDGAGPLGVVQAVDELRRRVPPSAASAGTSAPSAAMPTAMPAWRNVSLTPAARPLCSIGAELSATAITAGLNRPVPTAATRARHERGPELSTSPIVTRRHPAASASPTGDHHARRDLLAQRAVAPETKKITIVAGR